jgi:hypothetical protein
VHLLVRFLSYSTVPSPTKRSRGMREGVRGADVSRETSWRVDHFDHILTDEMLHKTSPSRASRQRAGPHYYDAQPLCYFLIRTERTVSNLMIRLLHRTNSYGHVGKLPRQAWAHS